MSDDASTVVGTGVFGAPNLLYTESGGAVIIGDGCASGLPAISGDGTTIVGCHVDANGNEKRRQMAWCDELASDLGSEAGAIPCVHTLERCLWD